MSRSGNFTYLSQRLQGYLCSYENLQKNQKNRAVSDEDLTLTGSLLMRLFIDLRVLLSIACESRLNSSAIEYPST